MEQDNSFDELNWFASTKAKLEGEAKDRDDKKTDRNTSGASFVSLKLWRSSPPVRTEQQKVLDLSFISDDTFISRCILHRNCMADLFS